jgi:hypothetical protein
MNDSMAIFFSPFSSGVTGYNAPRTLSAITGLLQRSFAAARSAIIGQKAEPYFPRWTWLSPHDTAILPPILYRIQGIMAWVLWTLFVKNRILA